MPVTATPTAMPTPDWAKRVAWALVAVALLGLAGLTAWVALRPKPAKTPVVTSTPATPTVAATTATAAATTPAVYPSSAATATAAAAAPITTAARESMAAGEEVVDAAQANSTRGVPPPPPPIHATPAHTPPLPQAKVYSTTPVCTVCGWVESVTLLEASAGLPAGATTAAAATLGAQAGQATAQGQGVRNPAAVAAAAMAGAAIGTEHRVPAGSPPLYEIRIRMEDGSLRIHHQPQPVALGTRVVFDNPAQQPHAASATAGGKTYSSR